jgi:hypothetical protein
MKTFKFFISFIFIFYLHLVSGQIIDVERPGFVCVGDEITLKLSVESGTTVERLKIETFNFEIVMEVEPTSISGNDYFFSFIFPESPTGDYFNDRASVEVIGESSTESINYSFPLRIFNDPNDIPINNFIPKSFCSNSSFITFEGSGEFLQIPTPLPNETENYLVLEYSVDGEIIVPTLVSPAQPYFWFQTIVISNIYPIGSHELCIRMINPFNVDCYEDICLPFEIKDPEEEPTFTVTGFSDNMDICLGQEVSFNNNFTYGQIEGDYIWTVSLPNDNNTIIYTQPHLDYTFHNAGTYEIGLGYINESGCTSPIYTESITVGDDPAIEIECPSVVCAGTLVQYCIPLDESCTILEWEVSSQGLIVSNDDRCISVQWSTEVDDYEVGYVNLISADNCDQSYCFPSSVAVPIFPTMSDIVGAELICDDGMYTYMLPVITNASYTWSSTPDFKISNGDDPNEYSILIPETYAGDVEISASVTNNILGCDFVTSMIASVINVNGSMEICEGDDLTFLFEGSTDKDVTYTITNTMGDIIYEVTLDPLLPFEYSGLAAGNYRLDITVDGLQCAQTIDIVVISIGTPVISGESTVCADQLYPYSISCNEHESAMWTISQGCDVTEYSGAEIEITWDSNIDACDPGDPSPYHISVIKTRTLTDGSICTSELAELWIQEEMINPVIEGLSTVCYDAYETYSVVPIPGASYSWSVMPSTDNITMGSIISGNGTPTIDVQWHLNPSITSAVLQLEVDFCDQITTVEYTVTFENLVVDMSGPDFLCTGEEAVFTLFSSNIPFGNIYESVEWYINDVLQDDADHILSTSFLENGTYTITAIIINPNQCIAEPHAISKTVNIYGAIPILSDITGVCPAVDFVSDEVCILNINEETTYDWYLGNNSEPALSGLGSFGGCYTINQIDLATYGNPLTITIDATVNQGQDEECTTSESYIVGWDCVAPCENCEDPGLEIFYVNFSGGSCDEIDFEGDIDDYENVLANLGTPYWRIWALDPSPDQIVTTLEIDQESKLTQNSISLAGYGPGTYRVSLVSLAEGDLGDEVPTDDDDFPDSFTGKYDNDSRMDCEDICNPLISMEITIPYIIDFDYELECLENGQYNLILTDASEYAINYNQAGVTKSWISNGTPIGEGNQVTVIVNQGDEINISYAFTDPNNTTYICNEESKTILAPTIDASFETENGFTCVGNLLTFNPLVYTDSEIYFLTWDFGDNTGSHLINPTKEYEVAQDYIVTLELEDIYGCITTSTLEITIIPQNDHLGHLEYTMGTCDAEAVITYVSDSPNEADILLYDWSYIEPLDETPDQLTIISSGPYDVTITDIDGCTYSPESVDISVEEAFGAGVSVSGNDCGNKTVSFETAESYDYLVVIDDVCEPWTSDILFDMPGDYEVSIYAFNPDKEIADCDNLQNACVFESVEFTILSSPPVEIIEEEIVECENSTLSLTNADNYTSIIWTLPGNISIESEEITITDAGSYFCTYSNPETGCERTVSSSVSGTSNIDFTSFIDGCFDYCLDDMTLITGYLTGIPGSYAYWEWRFDGDAIEDASGNGEVQNLDLGELSYITDLEHKIELYIEIQNNAGEVICSDTSDPFCITVEDCTECEDLIIQGEAICSTDEGTEFTYSYSNLHNIPSDASICSAGVSINNQDAELGNVELEIINGQLSIAFDFNIDDNDFIDETIFDIVLCDETGAESYCYTLALSSIVCMECEVFEIELPYPGCVHLYEHTCVVGESNGGPIYSYDGKSVLPDEWNVNLAGYTVSSNNGSVAISNIDILNYTNAPLGLSNQTLDLSFHYAPDDPSLATTIEFMFYDEFGNLEYCYQIYLPVLDCPDDHYECNMDVNDIYSIYDPCAGIDEVKIEVCADMYTAGSDKCDITEFNFDVTMYNPLDFNGTFSQLDNFILSGVDNDFSEQICFELTIPTSTFIENEGWCIEIIATSNCEGVVCSEVLCDVFNKPGIIRGGVCLSSGSILNEKGNSNYMDYKVYLEIPEGYDYTTINAEVEEGTISELSNSKGVAEISWRTFQTRNRPIFSGKLILDNQQSTSCPKYKFPFYEKMRRCDDLESRGSSNLSGTEGNIEMKIYPIPSSGALTVSLNLDKEHLNKKLDLQIFNIIGDKIESVKINCESIECDRLYHIDSPGMYFIILLDGNIQLSYKKILIVE